MYALAALGLWVEDRWRPEWDSAIYLLAAQSLEAGEGYRYLGEPFFLRPPGLSWLLSFAAAPSGFDFALLNRFSMGFAVASVAGVYFAMRASLGSARALAVSLLTGTSLLVVTRFNFVLSDLPFLTLLFPALGLLDRGARGGRGAARDAFAGAVLIAAATYLRTAALAALPGVVLLYAWRRRGAARWLGWLPGIGVCAAIVPWLLHARRVAGEAPRPSEQLLLFDYTTALLRIDPGDPASPLLGPAGWWERIAANGGAIAHDLALGVSGSGEPVAIALLCAVVGLGVVAAVRRGPDAIDGFAIAYLGLLAIYFTNHSRLVIPLVPIVYRACFEGVGLVVEMLSRARSASAREPGDKAGEPGDVPAGAGDDPEFGTAAETAGVGAPPQWRASALAASVVASGLLAVNLAALPKRLDAARAPLAFGLQGAVWRDLETAAGWLAARTEPDDRVLAGPAPSLSLLSGRRVYTYRFARQPRLIERYDIRYAVLFPWTPERVAHQLRARAVGGQRIASSARPGEAIELLEIGAAGSDDGS